MLELPSSAACLRRPEPPLADHKEKIMKVNIYAKIVLSIALILLASVRWVFYETTSDRMDTVFFGLVLLAALVYFLPWENIKTLKAAGVELSIESSPVKAAINSLGLDRIEDEKLGKHLSNLEDELTSIHGGRVLWIDDKAHKIVGERRLLRALGIQVVPAISSEMAEEVLDSDNDFDLIISDVKRLGDSYKVTGGIKIHEGTNFVVKLRQHSDPIIQRMPVVFYGAYPWEKLVEFTRPARETQPEPEISNTVIDFVPKIIKQLAQSRATPIAYSPKKEPTSARWQK
jgi:CheY-like chemotaxis protein